MRRAILLIARAFSTTSKTLGEGYVRSSVLPCDRNGVERRQRAEPATLPRVLLRIMGETISEDRRQRPKDAALSVVADIEVRELKPAERNEWDNFVMASPSGTFFHLYEWQTVVRSALGHRSFMLAARGPEGVRGVFPIALVRSRIFGDCLVSMPLAVYGGICASDSDAYFSLLRAEATIWANGFA